MAGFPGGHSASQVAIGVSLKDRNFKCQFLSIRPISDLSQLLILCRMLLIDPKYLASACSFSPLGIIAGKDEIHGTEDLLRIPDFTGRMQSCVAAMPSLLPLLN
jgi:hypothetical protein